VRNPASTSPSNIFHYLDNTVIVSFVVVGIPAQPQPQYFSGWRVLVTLNRLSKILRRNSLQSTPLNPAAAVSLTSLRWPVRRRMPRDKSAGFRSKDLYRGEIFENGRRELANSVRMPVRWLCNTITCANTVVYMGKGTRSILDPLNIFWTPIEISRRTSTSQWFRSRCDGRLQDCGHCR
jgi:hypothetical protein